MNDVTEVNIVDHNEGYAQEIHARDHTFWADEPTELEGLDSGPTPFELLLAAIGSCTTVTMRMYARRKDWPLEQLRIRLTHEKAKRDGEEVDLIQKEIEMTGELSNEQRERLLEVADRCPVHRAITGNLKIETTGN